MTGTVYLVGAGPGAPDLLTVRAARLLGEADIVFHDALISPEILGLSKGLKIPVGKRCGKHSTAQRFINKRLADAARRHRVVVRLKGGDPMLFGRAHEEISYLKNNSIKVEVVPGVTAALAASAELGVSLTRRGLARSVTFATPRVGAGERYSNWATAVTAADTAAIYMGAGEGPAIAAALIAAGKPASTPIAVVENASLGTASVICGTLERLPRSTGGPVLILIGEVYREALQAGGGAAGAPAASTKVPLRLPAKRPMLARVDSSPPRSQDERDNRDSRRIRRAPRARHADAGDGRGRVRAAHHRGAVARTG